MYNKALTFSTAESCHAAFVGMATNDANHNQKFEFHTLKRRIGIPNSMSIFIDNKIELVVDYASDYDGKSFKYTDKRGRPHESKFFYGTVNF